MVKPKSPNVQKKLPLFNSPKKQSNLTNDFLSGNDSGTSYSQSGDETEEEKSVGGDEKPSAIQREESDVASEANFFSDEEKSLTDQVKKVTTSLLSTRVKSSLLWFVRNELFQKIKIISERHLQSDGEIIKEALKKVEFQEDKHNFFAYVQECRKLIRQTMCAKRGYVKRKLGSILRGMMNHCFYDVKNAI